MNSKNKENNDLQVTQAKPAETTHHTEIKSLFEKYYSMVYRAAFRVTGTADDAEDVLQTVFLRLLNPERRLSLSENPGAYLYRATVNASIDFLRRKKRWNMYELEEHDYVSQADGDTTLEGEELHHLLRRELLNLAPVESQVFILKYFEECSNKEISEILETSPNSVNVAFHKAKTKLKKKLSKYLGRVS
jgi:RNA polymerase sigma-70 factor (ECF subfamily)